MVSTPPADVTEATGCASVGGVVKIATDVWRESLRGRGEAGGGWLRLGLSAQGGVGMCA